MLLELPLLCVMELAIISLRSESSFEVNSRRDLYSFNGRPSCKDEFVLKLPFLVLTPKQSTLPQPSEDALELEGKDSNDDVLICIIDREKEPTATKQGHFNTYAICSDGIMQMTMQTFIPRSGGMCRYATQAASIYMNF